MSYLNNGSANEVGGFEIADGVNIRQPAYVVAPKVVISLIGIVSVYLAAFSLEEVEFNPGMLTLITGGLLVYLGVAWFFRPEPNYNNLGWAGGLLDDPFKFSDGQNRFLLQLKILLLPGLFVTQSFIELATLLHLIPEVTREEIVERKATELASRMEPDSQDDSTGRVELSTAKYFKQTL